MGDDDKTLGSRPHGDETGAATPAPVSMETWRRVSAAGYPVGPIPDWARRRNRDRAKMLDPFFWSRQVR